MLVITYASRGVLTDYAFWFSLHVFALNLSSRPLFLTVLEELGMEELIR